MGALEYEPEKQDSSLAGEFLNLDGLAENSRQILNEEGSLEAVNTLLRLSGSSGGARPKILCQVRRNDLSVKAQASEPGYDPWLIKFRAREDPPETGLMEYLYSLAAKKAGLDMPDTALFPSKISEGYFGAKRFDRANEAKIHAHTACGLLHASHRWPSLSYEGLIRLTHLLTKDNRETEKMIRLMIFNVKAGNKDDHSKNFSFLINEEKRWKMAPAYDLTPSGGFGGEHSTTVNGKGRDITDADLAAAAQGYISEAKAKEMIGEVTEALSKFQIL